MTRGAALLALLAPAAAQSGPPAPPDASAVPPAGLFVERAFPHAALERWSARGLRLAPAAELAPAFTGTRRVRLVDVPWPAADGPEGIALEVERLQALAPDLEWHVDGRLAGGRGDLDAGLFLYSGRVAGEPDSHAYLAFSGTGSFGWIRRGDETVHLLSAPTDGDWHRPQSFLVHELDPTLPERAAFDCTALTPPGSPGGSGGSGHAAPPLPAGGLASRATSTFVAGMALETDWQYFQLFGDVTAATNYAVALFGAVSERFEDATGTVVLLPYLGIWSTPNDPWTSQDNGGSAGAVLDEFRTAWGGQPLPGNAHVAHLISGAGLGGGVAYVDVLCNTSWGFAVSGNLHGMNPFPVPQSHNLNWDFFVSAHETGHQFGTPHTHDYCPPIDQCAGPGAFGSCQTSQVCQRGTIMSYCHGCPGGMANVDAEFHPTVATLLRQRIAASCVPSYPPASATTRNGSGLNPTDFVSWSTPSLGSTWWTTIDLAPSGGRGSVLAAVTTGPMQGIVVPWGEILLDLRGPFVAPPQAGLGVHAVLIPDDVTLLGVRLYTQAAAVGPAGVVLQNAIDAQLGL